MNYATVALRDSNETKRSGSASFQRELGREGPKKETHPSSIGPVTVVGLGLGKAGTANRLFLVEPAPPELDPTFPSFPIPSFLNTSETSPLLSVRLLPKAEAVLARGAGVESVAETRVVRRRDWVARC